MELERVPLFAKPAKGQPLPTGFTLSIHAKGSAWFGEELRFRGTRGADPDHLQKTDAPRIPGNNPPEQSVLETMVARRRPKCRFATDSPLLGAVLSDVTLRDLTFEGENLGDYYGTQDFAGYADVQVLRSNLDAENCSFTGFRETVEGDQYSAALRVGSMHPVSNTARIVECTFANNAESIYLRGSGQALNLVITVENNIIIGPGPSTKEVISSSIAILQGVGGRVANNRISGYSYAGGDRQFPVNFGILADNEANFPEYGILEHLEFVGNTFKDNQIHLAMIKGDGCIISNNVFQQIVQGPFAAGVVASGKKPVIAKSYFGDLEDGVRLFGVDPTFQTLFGQAVEVQFTDNRFCKVTKPVVIQRTASAVQSDTLVCLFPAPSLEIRPSVIVTWPAEDTGWILESAASVEGPWSDAPGTHFIQEGRHNVVIPVLAEKLFFRLH